MLIKCPRCCFQLTVYLRYYHESTCSINRALFYIMSFMISVVIIWNWLNTSRVSIYSLLLSGFSHITSLSTDCSTEENIEILINFVQNSWKSHYLNFWDELLSENSIWENFEYQQWGFFAMIICHERLIWRRAKHIVARGRGEERWRFFFSSEIHDRHATYFYFEKTQ